MSFDPALIQNDPRAPIEPELFKLLCRLLGVSIGLLAQGEELRPMAFIGSVQEPHWFTPLMLEFPNEQGKDQSVDLIRRAVLQSQAEFAALLSESWGLSSEDIPRRDEIRKQYGSVSEYPGRVDMLVLVLETREFRWVADTNLKKQDSGHGREFGSPLKFRFQGSSQTPQASRMSNFFLPGRGH